MVFGSRHLSFHVKRDPTSYDAPMADDGFTFDMVADVDASVQCAVPCVPECPRCHPVESAE